MRSQPFPRGRGVTRRSAIALAAAALARPEVAFGQSAVPLTIAGVPEDLFLCVLIVF